MLNSVFLTDTFYTVFGKVTTYLCLLPLITGLINIKFLKKEIIPVFVLLIIIAITEGANTIIGELGHNTYPITRIYTIAEFSSLIFFYKIFFEQHTKKTTIFYFMLATFLLIALIDAFVINSIYQSDTLASSVEGIVLIVCSVAAFYLIMNKMVYVNLLHEPFFWINSAYLIYFSGTLFLFIFLNFILAHNRADFAKLYFINSLLNLVNYTLISIGFWKTRKA